MNQQDPDLSSCSINGEQRLRVEQELERILTSAMFRTSKRSQEFLRYIVLTALDGRFDELKERVIGNQVFHRLPDYDTGEHSIVRVKANELRKRLAQFYSETGEAPFVQIQLPRGSYTPELRWTEPPALELLPARNQPALELHRSLPETRSRLRLLLAAAALIVVGLVSWQIYQRAHVAGVEERFWKPLFTDSAAPLICIANPEVLKLDEKYDALAFNGNLPPNIPSSELVKDSGHYVGWGDALALSEINTFLILHHKNPDLRIGMDASFSDLSRSPVILIGARSNPWTMQLANNLRFVFERTGTESYIRDTKDPAKKWAFTLGPPKVDYIIISRVFESKTGKMIVLAAGLSHYGTQMAGVVLTNPTYLSKALRNAPPDWPDKNMQLLLRVEVFGDTAGPPTLLASSFW